MSSLSCENVQLQQRYAAGKFDEFCDIKLVDCDNKTSYGIPSGLLVTYSTNLVEMAKAVKEQAVHTSLTPNALKVFVQAIFGKPLTETCPIDSEANIATLQSLYEFGHKLDVVGLQEALVVDIKSPSYSHPQPAAMGNFYASIHKEDLLLSNEVFEALLQHVQFAKRSIYPMPTVTGYIPDHALAPRHIERLVSVLNTWTHYDAEQKLQVLLLEMKTVMSAEGVTDEHWSQSPDLSAFCPPVKTRTQGRPAEDVERFDALTTSWSGWSESIKDSLLSRVVKELVDALVSFNRWYSHEEYDIVLKKLQQAEDQLQQEKEKNNKRRSDKKRQRIAEASVIVDPVLFEDILVV